jgi:hypothetical protein
MDEVCGLVYHGEEGGVPNSEMSLVDLLRNAQVPSFLPGSEPCGILEGPGRG